MRSYSDAIDERELRESVPLKKFSDRQTMLARHALHSLHRSLDQFEAVLARDTPRVVVKVCGGDLTSSAGWPAISQAIARDRFDAVRYWVFWAEQYFDLDQATKCRIGNAFLEFDCWEAG